jgi:hypothetical protein
VPRGVRNTNADTPTNFRDTRACVCRKCTIYRGYKVLTGHVSSKDLEALASLRSPACQFDPELQRRKRIAMARRAG